MHHLPIKQGDSLARLTCRALILTSKCAKPAGERLLFKDQRSIYHNENEMQFENSGVAFLG